MGIIINKPSYRGVELQEFQTRAFYKKNAVDRFTILPNVKGRFGVNFLDFSGAVLGVDGCEFNPNVNLNLSDKILDVDTFSIDFEECVETFEQSYLADELRAGANSVDFPTSFEAWIMEKLPLAIGDELERKAFDQIVAEASIDANVTTATIAPITTTNAIEEIGKVFNAISGELFGNPDLAIFMNVNMWKTYLQSAFDTSVPQLITDGIKMTYLGVELVPAPVYNLAKGGGLADNVIIAGVMSNFIRATDLLSDDSELNLLDMRQTTGDKKVRVTGRIKFKATYSISEEVVLATV